MREGLGGGEGKELKAGGLEEGRTGQQHPGAFESDAFEFQEMFAWELCRQNPGVKSKLLSGQVLR